MAEQILEGGIARAQGSTSPENAPDVWRLSSALAEIHFLKSNWRDAEATLATAAQDGLVSPAALGINGQGWDREVQASCSLAASIHEMARTALVRSHSLP